MITLGARHADGFAAFELHGDVATDVEFTATALQALPGWAGAALGFAVELEVQGRVRAEAFLAWVLL